MTEERIKAIKAELVARIESGLNKNNIAEFIERYIRTVAAEARKEGRKEGRREGINELCNSLSNRLRRGPQAGVALIVEDEAECLKEKV